MADSTHLVVTERPPAGPQRRPARLTPLMGPALVAASLVAIEALPHTKPRITR